MEQPASTWSGWLTALVVLVIIATGFGIFLWARGGQALDVPSTASAASGVVPIVVPMVSYEEVRQEYGRRKTGLQAEIDRITRGQQRLAELNYAQMPAEVLLQSASHQERSNLATILKIPVDTSPEELVLALRRAGSHSAATLARWGKPVEYEEVAADAARRLGAKGPLPRGSPLELERVAIRAALENVLANSSPQQREALLAELAKSQGPSSGILVTSSGALVLANLSGFALYAGASTALGAVSGALGVTLPFAVYTGMSSVIAVAIGPVGWAVLAAGAVYTFGGTNYKKTIPGVLAIATSRSRLVAQRDEVLAELASNRAALDRRAERLAGVAKFLQEMQLAGPTNRVPKSTVPW